MTKWQLMIGCILCICIGLLTGCVDQKNFIVSYDEIGSFGYKTTDEGITMYTLEMVSSLQALKDACDAWNNQAFQENSEHYKTELSQKIRSYDESFFSDRNLIIYSFERGHYHETKINDIDIIDSQLTIEAQYIIKKGSFTDEAFNWLILIEVNKTDVTGVVTIEVEYK